MRRLYTILILLHSRMIWLAQPFSPKAKAWWQGRKTQEKTLTGSTEWASQKRIWIHAASYGEYEMIKPVVKRLLQHDQVRLYVSFFSPSGYENIHFDDERMIKLYLPIDSPGRVRAFLDKLRPHKVIFVKYEFWFNLAQALAERGIDYYYTSIHVNENSHLLRVPFFKKALTEAHQLYAHNPESVQILKESGLSNVTMMGDTRVNHALSYLHVKKELRWTDPKPVIIYGSATLAELPMITQAIQAFRSHNHIVAPHDIDTATLHRWETALTIKPGRYSDYEGGAVSEQVLLVDTLGDLKHLYQHSSAAYVGAGFEKGPHNVVEPMIYGVPTIVGPHIQKFPLATHLAGRGYLTVLRSKKDLANALADVLELTADKRKEMVHYISGLEADIESLIDEMTREDSFV